MVLAALVLMALVPLLVLFGAGMMAAEAERTTRAGEHLTQLEGGSTSLSQGRVQL